MKYLKNVSTLKLSQDKCTGCRMCEIVCPHGVFKVENRKANIVDIDLCMECGACKKNCSFNAIEVDAGVGCAYAVYASGFKKGRKISCDCDDAGGCCS